MKNRNDVEIANEYIRTFSTKNAGSKSFYEKLGYKLYESDGGAYFAVGDDAPDLAHGLASAAAMGDPNAIDAIYADTDSEVESSYRMKSAGKSSINPKLIDSASKLK
jgi:hypothetical protein